MNSTDLLVCASIAFKPFIFKVNCLTWEGNTLELPTGRRKVWSVGDRG